MHPFEHFRSFKGLGMGFKACLNVGLMKKKVITCSIFIRRIEKAILAFNHQSSVN